ncbi:DNA-directed RNA polymerase III subunit RPC4 [Callorhinchus milii]|nr:DNA-directed RNA polymerase III subunit RPC4 [Callorhinchus milii]
MCDSGSGAAGGRPGPGAARGLTGRRNAASPVTPGRLPSIRSRDLTLGGVKKKTFTPNIISRKVKEEPKGEDGAQRKEKKDRERDRQRDGRGRGRGRPETIQSHSIFEQGPAETMVKKAGWSSTVEPHDFGPSPIINIKKEKRETAEETKEILRRLDRDDFLDDPGLKNDARNMPVQLPLAQSGWIFREEEQEEEKEKEEESPKPAAAKEEKMEVEPTDVKVKDEAAEEAGVRKLAGQPEDVSLCELLRELSLGQEEELLFLQLPDTLPGQPPTLDHKPLKTEVQTEDGQTVLLKQEKSQEAAQAENSCSLRDLSEGPIGKLLIRKSGRVQLVLAKVTLDVTKGTTCSFLQELVSVGIGESRSGELSVLGHIRHKLVCSPDFETLLAARQ